MIKYWLTLIHQNGEVRNLDALLSYELTIIIPYVRKLGVSTIFGRMNGEIVEGGCIGDYKFPSKLSMKEILIVIEKLRKNCHLKKESLKTKSHLDDMLSKKESIKSKYKI